MIFSTDVEATYPSLDIDTVAKVTGEEFINSNLDIEYDTDEMSLYLSVTNTRKQLVDLGMGEITHRRIHNRGQTPGITT